ncbi:MAG: adenylate/guanylate cyclase domain-containing protein [Paracoccaceae bacterium]
MRDLWRGSWATRIRIASGLVLMLYVFLHFINIGLGLFGPDAMEAFQEFRQTLTRTFVGEVILYAALMAHLGLSLWRIARRGTLRMPVWEAVQTALGLLIPLFLVKHIVFTKFAHEMYGVEDEYSYLIALIWGTNDGLIQNLLLLVVWVHGCIGMHFWLAGKDWWRNSIPTLTGIATLVPGFSFVGYLVEGRRVANEMSDPDNRTDLLTEWNWPDRDSILSLIDLSDTIWWIVAASMIAAVGALAIRRIAIKRRSVRIKYVDGPEINAPKGATLLEMSRTNGVPHTSMCGGRGRCTTCRVIVEEGGDLLHPPSPTEERSLKAVGAPPGARLACQIRPVEPMTVYRVFRPDGSMRRAHASEGTEEELALIFLDIRGFTARTTGQLPYDVVFLLNRFFDAIVPAVTEAGGTVDKYLGDGFLALFETGDAKSSAQAGLRAVQGISAALEQFNAGLKAEGIEQLKVGIGLHLGEVVIGEIGARGNAPRTLIGNTVNTASRLEAKTKELAVQLLVSDAVLHAAGYETTGLDMRELELRGVARLLCALPLEKGTDLGPLLEQLDAKQPVAAE